MSTKKLIQYGSQHFGITQTSAHSASVQLICGSHEHEEFLIRLIEETDAHWVSHGSDTRECDWAVGRESQGYPVKGELPSALENAADLLLEECSAITDIANYFGDDANMATTGKAQTLYGRLFIVSKLSTIAAKVAIVCESHEHRYHIIGLLENEAAGWMIGRTEAADPKYSHEGSFSDAVEEAANLLLRECQCMSELDAFFADE